MLAAVITCSDRAASGAYSDRSGPLLREALDDLGFETRDPRVVPDNLVMIRAAIREAVASGARVVLTTGGRSEAFAMREVRRDRPELPPACFVQMGDFLRYALDEVVAQGIRLVVFGLMVGKLTKIAQGETYLAQMRAAVPTHTLGTPQDIGYAACFLASREAAYITGQTIIIDGGQILPESAEALANMDLHELTAFIIEKGKNRFSNPDAVAKAIQKAARSSYRLPKTVNDSVNQVLSISITSMKTLEAQIKEFDKAIKSQMELLSNVLISVPGIGPVYSAGIMAEIGDINRFNNQAALAKYAGLAWKQHQSGGFEAETTRLIPSGNRFLKYYLCEAAFSLVRCDKEYSDFYHLKYKEVNRYQHKRALALTARKFVRLVFRLLKDNRLYCLAK